MRVLEELCHIRRKVLSLNDVRTWDHPSLFTIRLVECETEKIDFVKQSSEAESCSSNKTRKVHFTVAV